MDSIVLMMMNVDTLECAIQMLIVPILMVHLNAHVPPVSLVMANHVVILMNVLLELVITMLPVPMCQEVSCVNVIKASLAMVSRVLILTNVITLHVLSMVHVTTLAVTLCAHVKMDMLVMDTHVLLFPNVVNVIHAMKMPNVTELDVKQPVNVTKDTKETAKYAEMSTNVELEKPCALLMLSALMFQVHTDVNVNLVLLVMATNASMSTNVSTLHVERTQHAQTHPALTDAHATEATK
jgi:hypothetical protein